MLRNTNRNELLGYVSKCEQAHIIRVGNGHLTNSDITETPDDTPKSLSRKYIQKNIKITKEHDTDSIQKATAGR